MKTTTKSPQLGSRRIGTLLLILEHPVLRGQGIHKPRRDRSRNQPLAQIGNDRSLDVALQRTRSIQRIVPILRAVWEIPNTNV